MHQRQFVADAVNRVDYVIELLEVEFFDVSARDQVVDGVAFALGIDRQNAFAKDLDLGSLQTVGSGMQLSVCIADIDIVVIDQADSTDARARAGLCRPGADSADADDAEVGAL